MDRAEERRIAAKVWATGPSEDTGLSIDNPECALARATDLLGLVETCYGLAQELLDEDGPEVGSLALVVEALEDHYDRVAAAAQLACEQGPHLRAVRDPD